MEGYFCSKALAVIQPQNDNQCVQVTCDIFDLNGNTLSNVVIPRIPEYVRLPQVTSSEDAVFVIGGQDRMKRITARCYKLDLHSKSWHRIADLNAGRIYHTACVVGGQIIVTGGFTEMQNGRKTMLGTTELYDMSNDTWMYVAVHPPIAKNSPDFIGLYEAASCAWRGKCIVSAFKTVRIYDPSTDKWSVLTELNEGRHAHSVVVVNDCIYVIGGTVPTSIEMYDEALGKFVIQAHLPMQKCFANALCYKNNIVYSCGRIQFGGPWPEMTVFDVVTKEIKHVDLKLSEKDDNHAVLIIFRNPPSLRNLLIMAIKSYFYKLGNDMQGIQDLPLPASLKCNLLPVQRV